MDNTLILVSISWSFKEREAAVAPAAVPPLIPPFVFLAIDEFSDVAGSVQAGGIDEKSVGVEDPAVVALSRRSIYSVETVAEIVEKQGIEGAASAIVTLRGVLLQVFLFLLSVR